MQDFGVTKSVTPNPENGLKTVLLQALKKISKEELIVLLADAMKAPDERHGE